MLYPSLCRDLIARQVGHRLCAYLARAVLVFCIGVLPVSADLSDLNNMVNPAETPSGLTKALVERGEAYRLSGQLAPALADLERAAATAPTAAEQAYARTAFGVALLEAGRGTDAISNLEAALSVPDMHPALTAVASATLARALATARLVETSAMRAARINDALTLADRADRAARSAGPIVGGLVAATRARLIFANSDDPDRAAIAGTILTDALANLQISGPNAAQVHLQIGDAAQMIGANTLALAAYRNAGQAGGRVGALAALGLAEASLNAALFEDTIDQSARALRYASETGADDIAFSADWIRAEALSRAGDLPRASAAYEAAFTGLRDFRARAPLGAPPATSARRFAPRRFQLDYIDFLLRNASRVDAPPATLTKARDLVEDLKLDEIDDYFAERCTPARGRPTEAGQLAADAAILYPVVFEDRTDIIWTIGDQIGKYSAPLGRDGLRAEITRLRYLIDLRVGAVTNPASTLYDTLIRPIETQLKAAGVRTLVVAPDGPLRALPFAALWDGEMWLGQQYGLATILGLNLLDLDQNQLSEANVLAAGAEDVGGGYPPLPSVPLELAAIEAIFGAELLAEDGFDADTLSAEIARQPYDIVHIATHAEFGAQPSDNFIATSDGRLDVTRLEATLRARAVQTESPVGLLTLSACNTAAELEGDSAERATLGLAGVGFRAGARSVVASLWPAEDLSTARLMEAFYREIRAGAGRGEALRRAQAELIGDPETAEPFQWANFLLIGDWR